MKNKIAISFLLIAFMSLNLYAQKGSKSDQLAKEGFYQLGDEDIVGAEARFRKAIAIDKNHARAHLGLGDISLSRGDFESAEHFYHKTIALDTGSADAYAGLGSVKYEVNQKDSAIYYLSLADLISPSIENKIFLAEIFKGMKNKKKALEFAWEAFKRDPKNEEAMYILQELGVSVEEQEMFLKEDQEMVPEEIQ